MTREERKEAVERLNALKQFIGYDKDSEIVKATQKSLDMAIKALEQEPILEKDGTLIVTTEHYKNVGRVLVQYGTNGTLFYQDQDPEIVPIAVVKFDEDELREIVQEKVDEIKKNLIEQYLDKITADIQRLRGCSCSCSDGIIDDIEDIIDKYKAESEGINEIYRKADSV